jgi:hypothetical protein
VGMNKSGEEVRLFIQPDEIMELKRNFERGELEDYGNSQVYLFAFLAVYGSIFFYIIIYSGIIYSIFLTFLSLFIFILSFMAISYKLYWVPPYLVPEIITKLLMMPLVKSLNPEYRFKKNSNLMKDPKNWEMKIISDMITIKIEYICLDEWSFKSFDPGNNIVLITINGEGKLIRQILKHIIKIKPEPWKIIREKEFETRFKIPISKIKEDWEQHMSE